MIEWVKKFFGASSSSATAKERLRFVLMTDHLALAPEMIDQMKRDLVDVISRYVEVDREKVEVNFEREDRALAMLANIPIRGVGRPNGEGGGNASNTPAPIASEPSAETVVEDAADDLDTEDEADEEEARPVAAADVTSSAAGTSRKRRKKGAAKPATAH